ncbi:Fc.00g076280.m01.CDS01 [Cosmosporella sp. VM-42]
MDPLSITTGSLALAGTIGKVAVALTVFVRDVRDARSDIDAVSAELNSLKTILELLVEDVETATRPMPPILETRISGVLSTCSRVIDDIQDCLNQHEGSRLQKRMRWVAVGKGDMEKLRSTLEAHKATLNLALDMISITTIQEVRDTTNDIKIDTTEIHKDTEDIKEDTARILEAIAELQARLPPDDAPRFNMLQRYLDELTTYAESVIDGGSIKDFDSDRASTEGINLEPEIQDTTSLASHSEDGEQYVDAEQTSGPIFHEPPKPEITGSGVTIPNAQRMFDIPHHTPENRNPMFQRFNTASTLRNEEEGTSANGSLVRASTDASSNPPEIRNRVTELKNGDVNGSFVGEYTKDQLTLRPASPSPPESLGKAIELENEDVKRKMVGEYPASSHSSIDEARENPQSIFGAPLSALPPTALISVWCLKAQRPQPDKFHRVLIPQCMYVCGQYLKRLGREDARVSSMFPSSRKNTYLSELFESTPSINQLWDGRSTRLKGDFNGREAAHIMISFLEQLPKPLILKEDIPGFDDLMTKSPFKRGISSSRGFQAIEQMIKLLSPLRQGILFVLLEAVQVDWRNPHDDSEDRKMGRRTMRIIISRALFGRGVGVRSQEARNFRGDTIKYQQLLTREAERYKQVAELLMDSWPKLGLRVLEFEKAVPHIVYQDTGMAVVVKLAIKPGY